MGVGTGPIPGIAPPHCPPSDHLAHLLGTAARQHARLKCHSLLSRKCTNKKLKKNKKSINKIPNLKIKPIFTMYTFVFKFSTLKGILSIFFFNTEIFPTKNVADFHRYSWPLHLSLYLSHPPLFFSPFFILPVFSPPSADWWPSHPAHMWFAGR